MPDENPGNDLVSPSPMPIPAAKGLLWTGRIISAIPVLFMAGLGTFVLFVKPTMATEGMVKYGYPSSAAIPILIAEIVCALLYAIPQTSILGAILLTGYLGGAVATHVHASEPFYLPILFGILVWLGLLLREPRLRALFPFRR